MKKRFLILFFAYVVNYYRRQVVYCSINWKVSILEKFFASCNLSLLCFFVVSSILKLFTDIAHFFSPISSKSLKVLECIGYFFCITNITCYFSPLSIRRHLDFICYSFLSFKKLKYISQNFLFKLALMKLNNH